MILFILYIVSNVETPQIIKKTLWRFPGRRATDQLARFSSYLFVNRKLTDKRNSSIGGVSRYRIINGREVPDFIKDISG